MIGQTKCRQLLVMYSCRMCTAQITCASAVTLDISNRRGGGPVAVRASNEQVFEHVSTDGHEMSLAGDGAGGPCAVRSHVRGRAGTEGFPCDNYP